MFSLVVLFWILILALCSGSVYLDRRDEENL